MNSFYYFFILSTLFISNYSFAQNPLATCYSHTLAVIGSKEIILHPFKTEFFQIGEIISLNSYDEKFQLKANFFEKEKMVIIDSNWKMEEAIKNEVFHMNLAKFSYISLNRTYDGNFDPSSNSPELSLKNICALDENDIPFKKSHDYMLKNNLKKMDGIKFYKLSM